MKRDVADGISATINESFSCKPALLLGNGSLGNPRWIGVYAGDWEIVIYERETFWEACFFNGRVHHEHLKAASMRNAQHEAEQRIEFFEMAGASGACDGAQCHSSTLLAGDQSGVALEIDWATPRNS